MRSQEASLFQAPLGLTTPNRRWTILVRMASLSVGVIIEAFDPFVAGIILGTILDVVSFHLVCISLAFICQARGEMRCMGLR
jgi:hypothetical protein